MKRPDALQVRLVGAGPGDPDLLTFKAAKAIAWASVILIDDLVNRAVLQHASPEARITWVGKRGGCASTPQAFIERLMVREALAGERVVRLKGGDPMVFGRAGEEIAALRRAGIRFDVVPGITSAIAAAASLEASLTHRDFSQGIAFVTAHRRADANQAVVARDSGWAGLLRSGITLAFYMGVNRAAEIQAQALEQGLAPDTPVALVQDASSPDEKKLVSTLSHFVQDMLVSGIGSPAILLIGRAISEARGDLAALPPYFAKSAAVVNESA